MRKSRRQVPRRNQQSTFPISHPLAGTRVRFLPWSKGTQMRQRRSDMRELACARAHKRRMGRRRGSCKSRCCSQTAAKGGIYDLSEEALPLLDKT